MKKLILTLIFGLTYIPSISQVFRIDSMPKQGILLNKGWKWYAGDNPDFAKPDFDDLKWESIDPTKDIYDLPQISKNGEIGWFRLHFSKNSSIDKQLVLMIDQSGASEIFLNGKLIHVFGFLDTDKKNIKAFSTQNRPVSFPVSNDSVQVLSVRYALQPDLRYATHFGKQNNGLKISVLTTENAGDLYSANQSYSDRSNYRKASVFGILSFLFFTLFLFFPVRRANLYFSIYTFLLSIIWSKFCDLQIPNSIENLILLSNLLLGLQSIGYLFMLTSVYHILEQKRSWFYWSLVILGIVCIPTSVFIYGWGWYLFGFVFTNLINLDITCVALLASRKNKKGAWIIVTGGAIFLFCWIIFCFQFLNIFSNDLPIHFFDISILSIPVAFAIFLGYDFGLMNRVLEQKLIEIKSLSEEKQQILSAQNQTLEKQVEARTAELKASQNQLIQKEKLASLGELTAGIAHEIQNPLNFVNNFSELSVDLAKELKEEIKKPEKDWELIDDLTNDLTENQEKINHHGKRASSIVKGMLEHSHSSTGVKELTDINTLADEYLRLAYHGLRAKDSNFNATLETHFDENLPKIEVIPQDIGRVLLNLFNNAFYSVNVGGTLSSSAKVAVSTKKPDNFIEISILDNGTGMSEATKAKIFQPFFTTKPTGQGTGLGLSLAYDIITKGHGGTIEVESIEGEGSKFIIKLPI